MHLQLDRLLESGSAVEGDGRLVLRTHHDSNPLHGSLFELLEERWLLFAFPNVFEFWFLFVAATLHWRPSFRWTRRTTTTALIALLLLKLAHEYFLHVGQYLDDGFDSIDVVQAIWDWLTNPFR